MGREWKPKMSAESWGRFLLGVFLGVVLCLVGELMIFGLIEVLHTRAYGPRGEFFFPQGRVVRPGMTREQVDVIIHTFDEKDETRPGKTDYYLHPKKGASLLAPEYIISVEYDEEGLVKDVWMVD